MAYLYWIVALWASALYDWYAMEIHTPATATQLPAAKLWHQRWFNFLGSLVGWCALWLLLKELLPCIIGTCALEPSVLHVVLAFTAFVGVTGHLPMTVMGLITGVHGLWKLATDLMGKPLSNP